MIGPPVFSFPPFLSNSHSLVLWACSESLIHRAGREGQADWQKREQLESKEGE